MEYITIAGSVKLKRGVDTNHVFSHVESIEALKGCCWLTQRVGCYCHVQADGLVCGKEASSIIDTFDYIGQFVDEYSCIRINRCRWELDITLSPVVMNNMLSPVVDNQLKITC